MLCGLIHQNSCGCGGNHKEQEDNTRNDDWPEGSIAQGVFTLWSLPVWMKMAWRCLAFGSATTHQTPLAVAPYCKRHLHLVCVSPKEGLAPTWLHQCAHMFGPTGACTRFTTHCHLLLWRNGHFPLSFGGGLLIAWCEFPQFKSARNVLVAKCCTIQAIVHVHPLVVF